MSLPPGGICGEPTGYPRPRCTLPTGHPGAHSAQIIPEEMAEAVAEAIIARDQFTHDAAALRRTDAELKGRIRLNTRISIVLVFLATVNLLSIAIAWHAVL